MDIKFRLATEKDSNYIFINASYVKNWDLFLKSISQKLFFILERKGIRIGYMICFVYASYDAEKTIFWVEYLFIESKYRSFNNIAIIKNMLYNIRNIIAPYSVIRYGRMKKRNLSNSHFEIERIYQLED